ncbi:MAG TPA: potassium channel family protein [Pedobacter sp.]|nr:potassium channel family protein [Pedobacter sp.]
MNKIREIMLKNKEKADLELFQKIKADSKPDASDLWAISEERFIEWRKLHDFPVLLAHFDKVLLLFKEWKLANNLTNEIIITHGQITPFLEHKRFAKKDKMLYMCRHSTVDRQQEAINYKIPPPQSLSFGQPVKNELIYSFTSYLDWLKQKKKTQNILHINTRHEPNTVNERVFIHADVYAPSSDFELLKMGGIAVPVDQYSILKRGKRLEFANLCGLTFSGRINFGEDGNLSCSYCACDNWTFEDVDLPLLKLDHCSVNQLIMDGSKMQQWEIYDCVVNGDIYNSKLYDSRIIGGGFNPVTQDCTLSNTHIGIDQNIVDNNFQAYKSFKKIYQAQGEDGLAKLYYIRENEFIRKRIKGWMFLTKSLSYYYWEYGNKPHRIIYLSLGVIILFAIMFQLDSGLIAINSAAVKEFDFGTSLYFSTITFTTLGYGDLSPTGWLRILASIEAFIGVINMGFLIAGFSNNKY